MDQKDFHLVFIDLEKAYDRVPREILWNSPEKKCVMEVYIRAIKDMYEEVSTSLRTRGGDAEYFSIAV
jgi:hypothetical protein